MRIPRLGLAALWMGLPGLSMASGDGAFAGPQIGSIPLEFIFFGCVLAGVAFFHHYTLRIAVGGAVLISLYKILLSPFKTGVGLAGFIGHAGHEWVTLSNLFLLLLGFALLADHFRRANSPPPCPASCRASCPPTGGAVSWCCCWCSCSAAFWTTSPRR